MENQELDAVIAESKEGRKSIRKGSHGDRILEIRQREHKTQEELAEIIGIDPRTLRKIESGEAFLSGDGALKLYEEYGYSLDWLYGISEIAKDTDNILFSVDIRDIIRISKNSLTIQIKEYLYDLLRLLAEDSAVKESEIDESRLSYYVGIEKQKREFAYFNKRKYYCTKIELSQFELKTSDNS